MSRVSGAVRAEAAALVTDGVQAAGAHPNDRLSRLLLLAALCLATAFATMIGRSLPSKANQGDFAIYYVSALMMREGGDPYKAGLRTAGERLGLRTQPVDRSTDPPAFILCFEPLTRLRPRPAFWTWTAINFAALVASIALLLRREREISGYTRWAIVAAVILYPPVADHMMTGQNKLLILLMLVLVLCWTEQKRDASAGLILAAAGLLRVFPLLLTI
jgi:hypothetical protein